MNDIALNINTWCSGASMAELSADINKNTWLTRLFAVINKKIPG
jgi:hypothetical protein